jgi:heme exporter protein D
MDEQADDSLVLRELVPAEPLLPTPGLPLWVWLAIAAAVVALIALAFRLRRAKRERADPGRVRREAYQAALAELEVPPARGMQEAATRVSVALRRYLAAVSGDPALFETHEEFVARHQVLAGYPEELRKSTAEGFSHLARLKYGREAAGDPAALFAAARQLLDRLHQHSPA